MKITDIRLTPVEIPFRAAFQSRHGLRDKASLVLVELETDARITGLGECIAEPSPGFILEAYDRIRPLILGADPFEIDTIWNGAYRHLTGQPASDMDAMARLVLAGLDFALHDVMGKAVQRPVYALLGGAAHREIGYFAFIDGETPQAVAEMAADYVAQGFEVFYLKLGRGDAQDFACVAALREAIGDRRLRLDANEAWDTHQAIRMIRRLCAHGPEFIEQPVHRRAMGALAQVKRAAAVSIAADQAIRTPQDVYAHCAAGACDMIVLGAHEAGGLRQLRKAAAIAEAAGVSICLHGVPESGVTTLAHHHAALSIPNIDDGNQIMTRFLAHDLIAPPSVNLSAPRIGLPLDDGLGATFLELLY